jgi:hypothetical protein
MTPLTNSIFSAGQSSLDNAATLATALFTLGTRDLPRPGIASPNLGEYLVITNERDFRVPANALPEYVMYVNTPVEETGSGHMYARKVETSDVVSELTSIARRLHSQSEMLPADEQRILAENFWSLLA